MSYRLLVHQKARKEIQSLSTLDKRRIEQAIDALLENPRPFGYKKMTAYQSDRFPKQECYRIRVGDNRIIYTIEDEIITITIIQVKKRGDIY